MKGAGADRPVGPAVGPTLSAAAINRATLARQMLLEPADVDAVTAVGRLAGLQAQEAASPYIALWTRLADFDAAVRINPQYAVAYNNRGRTYQAMGDTTRALNDFERARQIEPENPAYQGFGMRR